MTEGLKELLKQYGVLTVTLNQLLRERPGTKHVSLDEYYKELGVPLPDEPVLAVRISKDGEVRFLQEGEHDVQFTNGEGSKTAMVTVWELPEDENIGSLRHFVQDCTKRYSRLPRRLT